MRSLKYKKKFNYTYNNPFRSAVIGGKDEEEVLQEEAEAEVREEKIDYATWRRRNGVRRDQRVFIIKGGYHDMRRALLDRGWVEN